MIPTVTDRAHTHVPLDPAILYFGTPVALVSTCDDQGHVNLAPMSSVFWLGQTAVLGFGSRSQSAANLTASRDCVINLPSVDQATAVDRLALTTGRFPVPPRKAEVGYRHEPDKFQRAGLTPIPSLTVAPPRAAECPVALEGRVMAYHGLEEYDEANRGGATLFEVRITQVHVHPEIRMPETDNKIDPDRWRPLIMSFQKFFGLGSQIRPSRLSSIDEEWYR